MNRKALFIFVFALTVLVVGCEKECYHMYIRSEEVIKEPTCSEEGIVKKCCTACDYSFEETIPPRHDYQLYETIEEPTCTKNGKAIYKCTFCEATEEQSVSADHSYYEGVCMDCGFVKPLPSLSIGMTKSQVERSCGEPIRKDKTTSSSGTLETWWYRGQNGSVAINFDTDGKIYLIVE